MKDILQHAHSIRTQVLCIMIALILPLNLLVLATTVNAISVTRRQTAISLENLSQLYLKQLEGRRDSVHYFLYSLETGDAHFLRLLYRQNDDSYYNLAKTNVARSFSENINTVAAADVYFYVDTVLEQSLVALPQSYRSGSQLQDQRQALISYLDTSVETLALGWQVVRADGVDWLLRLYQRDGFYYGAMICLDKYFQTIRQSIAFSGAQVTLLPADVPTPEGHLCVTTELESQMLLAVSVPMAQVLLTLPLSQWLALAVAAIYLLLIPALYFSLHRLLLRPLNKINSALQRMKAGEKDYRISTHHYAREFLEINRSFNEMADHIQTLKIENYEMELARRKLEFRTLQLQIRPHFLLNTFNLVFSLAELQEYKSVQKLALYLSNYFRYIFRSGRELESLEREIALVREYLQVSAIRYPGRYTVSYDIDPSLLEFLVPPLLIHSLVENIINHALRTAGTIQIELKAQEAGGYVIFTLSDTGAGMDSNLAQQFSHGQFHDGNGRLHVGLANSYQRIRYFYGGDSGMTVESAPGRGTTIILRLKKGESA